MKLNVLFFALVLCIALQSCKDDDPAPVFQITEPVLTTNDYTGTGTTTLLYSIDNGATFSPTLPTNLKAGTKILVKVSNGSNDLTDDDFSFDWTGSSPAPASSTADVAEFTVGTTNLTIKLDIKDLYTLLTSHRQNGKFYSLNLQTGVATEKFTPTFNGADLKDIRGFVYHPKQNLYYVSRSQGSGGDTYSINPTTHVATQLNKNDGDLNGDGIEDYTPWYAIANWTVASDDSLIAIGDFNDGIQGIVKVGTDGLRSEKIAEIDICCGLGMVWEDANTLLIANGWSSESGEIVLQKVKLNADLVSEISITTHENFPAAIGGWMTMKALAKAKDGILYGVLYEDNTSKSYFVKVDVANNKTIHISTLGANGSNLYNSMAFVPNHTL